MKTISDACAFAFALRVMGDYVPKGCDAAYLFGETADNQFSVIEAGANLWRNGYARRIAITELGASNGYPGFAAWQSALNDVGIGNNTIVPIVRTSEPTPNTFTEAVELVRHADRMGWKNVICVAPAFHLPRAFLGLVTAITAEKSSLKAHAKCGDYLPWGAEVVHSQGTVRGTRTDLLYGEFERIRKYDNLAHPAAAIEYLDGRDNR